MEKGEEGRTIHFGLGYGKIRIRSYLGLGCWERPNERTRGIVILGGGVEGIAAGLMKGRIGRYVEGEAGIASARFGRFVRLTRVELREGTSSGEDVCRSTCSWHGSVSSRPEPSLFFSLSQHTGHCLNPSNLVSECKSHRTPVNEYGCTAHIHNPSWGDDQSSFHDGPPKRAERVGRQEEKARSIRQMYKQRRHLDASLSPARRKRAST